MSNPHGYGAFESPEDLYPGTGNIPPLIYTGTYQIRQFGVGDGIGTPVTILPSLAHPPTNMVVAAAAAITFPVVTENDQFNYWPLQISGGTPSTVPADAISGGSP